MGEVITGSIEWLRRKLEAWLEAEKQYFAGCV